MPKKKNVNLPAITEDLTDARQVQLLNLCYTGFVGTPDWQILSEKDKEDMRLVMHYFNRELKVRVKV